MRRRWLVWMAGFALVLAAAGTMSAQVTQATQPVEQTPAQAAPQTPVQTPTQTPVQSPTQTPVQTTTQAPVHGPIQILKPTQSTNAKQSTKPTQTPPQILMQAPASELPQTEAPEAPRRLLGPIAPMGWRNFMSAAAPKEEGTVKPGVELSEPMLYGPEGCESSVLGIEDPEAAAATRALESAERGCTRTKIPAVNLFVKFTSTWVPYPMTPQQKMKLAVHDVIDPFNLLTIAGLSAIDVAENSHSPYGPGMFGFGKDAGVALTQDMTGEFVGTFLICTVMHQDPHYHRMPQASIPTRIGHALLQVLVTQNDSGRPMFNYEDTVGYVIEDKISSLYVPGLHSDIKSTAARVGIGVATAPIGNVITEFLPDLAKRVNIHTIFVQRIIDQVARDNGSGGP